ncbi:MAG: Fic family protein, partial [Chlamydiota bacterium]
NIALIQKNLCPLSFVDVPEELYISGLLGIYELNRIELLRDVFVWAYERSSSLYSAARQKLGEPDLFRLEHRDLIISTIKEIVRKCMNKQSAVAFIKKTALTTLPKNNHAKFIQVIEKQLMGLHKGNIARFKLKLSEYDTWIKPWC